MATKGYSVTVLFLVIIRTAQTQQYNTTIRTPLVEKDEILVSF